MTSRSNQLLLGVIVLLLGLFVLFQRYIFIDLTAIMLIVCGGALVVLYKTKHKSWSLILGGYMIYIGVTNIIGYYIPGFNAWDIIGAMFFIVPGIIFFILYFEKGKRGLLIPASILVWLGLFTIVKNLSFININKFSLWLVFMGFAFYTVNFFGRGFMSRWAFKVGTILVFISIICMGGFWKFAELLKSIPQLFAVFLILLSVVIIIKALINHKE